MYKSLDEIKEFFRDKRVIVVGNSVEMMTKANAKLIDSYDIVIRLGRGIKTTPEDEVAVGKKVDVWISGLFRIKLLQEPEIQEKLKDKLILLNGSRIDVTDGWLSKTIQEYNYTPIFSDSEILEFYNKYGIINNSKKSFRFSNGMWTIFFLLEKVKTHKSLDIIGFDFFKSLIDYPVKETTLIPSSWHVPSVGSDALVHNGPFEEKLVTNYISENRLNWIKLNNNINKRIYKKVKYGTLGKKLLNKEIQDKKILDSINVINLNITNACNLSCHFCPIGTPEYVNDNAMMSLETVEMFINRLKEFVGLTGKRVTVSLSGKGEVTIHKKFKEIVLMLAEHKNVLRLQMITNGALMYKYRDLIPLFDRIRYNDYTEDNNKNKAKLLEYVKDFSKVEVVPIDNTRKWFEIKDFTNRVGMLETLDSSKIEFNYCHKLFNKLMIECDGSYLVCCDDWKKIKNFGTVYEKSFKDHLLSYSMRKYRKDILNNTRTMEPCNTCTYSSNPKRYKDD